MLNQRSFLVVASSLSLFALIGVSACTEAVQAASASEAQVAAQALATDGGEGRRPRGERPHEPPPEAFEACVSKAVGDVCTVALKDKTIDGTCAAPPAGAPDARIACRPNDMPHGGQHRSPPAEAFTACDGKSAADVCSVTIHDHTIEGSCLAPPPDSGQTRLACAPPHHEGGPGRRQ